MTVGPAPRGWLKAIGTNAEVRSGFTLAEPPLRCSYSMRTGFAYCGDGLRHSKTTGGATTAYTWDVAAGLPVVLQDGTHTYVYGLGLISQTDGAGNQTYVLGMGWGAARC
jgi:hypothetical protein